MTAPDIIQFKGVAERGLGLLLEKAIAMMEVAEKTRAIIYGRKEQDTPVTSSVCNTAATHESHPPPRAVLWVARKTESNSRHSILEEKASSTSNACCTWGPMYFALIGFCFSSHFYFPASRQAVVTGVVPSPSWFLPSIFIAHGAQQSHCLSNFHPVLLTDALELPASQFVHKGKCQRMYMSMHSAGLELTKLTYTRLEDSLIRHQGDR